MNQLNNKKELGLGSRVSDVAEHELCWFFFSIKGIKDIGCLNIIQLSILNATWTCFLLAHTR